MQLNNPFFQHECHKCGVADEARFVNAGPHVKQVCNNCGFYVKFFDKTLIPDVKDIRLKIWFVCEQDATVITNLKQQCEFVESLQGLQAKLQWWKLYLAARRLAAA